MILLNEKFVSFTFCIVFIFCRFIVVLCDMLNYFLQIPLLIRFTKLDLELQQGKKRPLLVILLNLSMKIRKIRSILMI